MATQPTLSPASPRPNLPWHWVPPLVIAAIGLIAVVAAVLIPRSQANAAAHGAILALGLLALWSAGLVYAFLRRSAYSLEDLQSERERCQEQHQQLLALHSISETVNSSLDRDTVLNKALDQVLSVMNLESGDVRLIRDGQLVLVAARQVSAQFVAAEEIIPLGHCACGKAAEAGRLIAIEDVGRSQTLQRTTCACEQFASVLSVPVRTTDRIVGVIHAASRTQRSFSDDERDLLTAIGHQVGVAIEKAQLHGELESLNRQLEARVAERTEELAAAKEALAQKADALHHMLVEERRIEERTRARIAHDLHDGVQQLIIGAMFEAQAARDTLRGQPDTAARKLAETHLLLQRVEQEMRGAIYSLRPVALDAHGLVPALRECTATFQETSGIPCPLIVTGTPRRFDPDAEVVAFRIVQEALNNAETHARAHGVQVRACFEDTALHVSITDDGTGFDMASVEAQPRSHLGLMGMRERADSIGGRLAIRSREGAGTEVRLTIPAAAAERDPCRDSEAG